MQKIFFLFLMFCISCGGVFASDIDPIVQAKTLLDQYSARVKVLENENIILREEMRKANIQIPLSLFSGAVTNTPIVSVSTGTQTSTVATGTVLEPVVSTGVTNTGAIETALSGIEKSYGSTYAGFVRRIGNEWSKVRDAYLLPSGSQIGGYEFVSSGSLDHVFVDIVYSGALSGSGVYDAKILYQFDKTTFARKLIGFFEYNHQTGYYVTKTGKNTFPGSKRTWVADPRFHAVVGAPTTTSTTNPSSVTPTTSPSSSSVSSSVVYTDIEAAYTAKKYLSVITLSNTWLTKNAPTLEVLRIRYRTYFIIAKYTEALAEIGKIQSLGQLSSAVACEGYVIATYAKNTTIADQYKAICNKK